MSCIDQGHASVRSGWAGDALCIVKRPRRGNRVTLIDPKGRLFKALERRLTPLAMDAASRRNAILAQGLEKAVQPVTISQTGSKSFKTRGAAAQGCWHRPGRRFSFAR